MQDKRNYNRSPPPNKYLKQDRNGSLNTGKSTWLRDNQLLNLEEIKE
jgi:hypothetical protein